MFKFQKNIQIQHKTEDKYIKKGPAKFQGSIFFLYSEQNPRVLKLAKGEQNKQLRKRARKE